MSNSYENYQKYIEEISEFFFKAINKNSTPWTKSWSAKELQFNAPKNPITKTIFRGLNSLHLDIVREDNSYSTNLWLTFNQIKKLGGYLESNTKSTPIAFYSKVKKVKEKDHEGILKEKTIELNEPIFIKSSVFNLDQTIGISKEKINELLKERYESRNESSSISENILNNIDLPIEYSNGTDRSYYSIEKEFKKKESYNVAKDNISFAKEELQREIYYYLQAKELGLDLDLERHQSYVKNWASILKSDKKEIINAIKDAMKMVKYVKENYIKKNIEKEEEKTLKIEDIPLLLNSDIIENKEINKIIATDLYKRADVSIRDLKNGKIYFKVGNKVISVLEKDSIYEIVNQKKYVSNLFDVSNSMFRNKAEIIKDNRKDQKDITYKEYPKIPMDQLVAQLGYEIKRDKTSRNSIVMTNGIETIVITIGKGVEDNITKEIKGEGNYLYYNTDKELNDRGTIFNFCKNRNINTKDLINGTNINMDSHIISKSEKNVYDAKINEEYKKLKSYNDSKINTLSTIRKMSKKIIEHFPAIKVDRFKNIIFPTYTVEDNLLKLSGMNKKLISNPLTHDKEGNKYQKPITALEYGKPGLSILKTQFCKSEKVEIIVVGENSMDNLSYVELNHIELDKALLVSFNGGLKEDGVIAFKHLLENTVTNAKVVIKAFDNDKAGREFDEKLSFIIKNINSKIKEETHKSVQKDWNEDLKFTKKYLNKANFEKIKEPEKADKSR